MAQHEGQRRPRAGRPAGLRERNKQGKLERIRRAARALFMRDGFEATTTRAIAARAGIGTGTLFLYVRDKSALLFLIFKEEVDRLEAETYASLPGAERGLVEQLVHVFECWIEHYRRSPELARLFFKELLFVGGEGRAEVAALSAHIVRRLADVIEAARRQGRIREDVQSWVAAYNVFALFYVTLLSWLSDQIQVGEARAAVREALAMLYAGLHPRDAGVSPRGRQRRRP